MCLTDGELPQFRVWSAHPSRSVLVSRVVCGVGAAQSRAAARTMTLTSKRQVKNAPGPDIGNADETRVTGKKTKVENACMRVCSVKTVSSRTTLASASGFAFAELRDKIWILLSRPSGFEIELVVSPRATPIYWYFSSRTAPRMAPRDR